MRIYLIGFMGAGKSYLGRRLAEALDMDFIDLDELIVERAEKSIPEIFQEDGEAAFRALELGCLRSLGGQEDLLVACGGGTPCFFDNMEWMVHDGQTIFLDVPVATLLERLRPEIAQRPLLAGKSEKELHSFLEEKLAERRPFYEQAAVVYREEGVEGLVEQLKKG